MLLALRALQTEKGTHLSWESPYVALSLCMVPPPPAATWPTVMCVLRPPASTATLGPASRTVRVLWKEL